MNGLSVDLSAGLPDSMYLLRVLFRMSWAMLLGGWIGFARLRVGKAAGIRTHAMVALGAALFTAVAVESTKASELSRVIQGVATGVGFLGAGTILKMSEQHRIEGLTTAASIWLTAADGMSVATGWVWPAPCPVVLGWLTLTVGRKLEHWIHPPAPSDGEGN